MRREEIGAKCNMSKWKAEIIKLEEIKEEKTRTMQSGYLANFLILIDIIRSAPLKAVAGV